MYVTTVVFLLLSWYLGNVLPQEYGTPLAWNFPCQRRYWKKAEVVGGVAAREVQIGPSTVKLDIGGAAMRGVLKAAGKFGKVLKQARLRAESDLNSVIEPLDADTAAIVESGRALVLTNLTRTFPSDVPRKRFIAVDSIELTMAEV
jgi:hypothetical protein